MSADRRDICIRALQYAEPYAPKMRYITRMFEIILTIWVTNLKTNVLLKRFSALFAGVDGIRVGVAFVANKSTRILTALATLGANEGLALIVVTSQVLLQIVLIL